MLAAIAAGALVTALLPGSGGADTAPALRDRTAGLERSERGVVLELYALEASLGRARARADGLRARSAELEQHAAESRKQARIMRNGLALSRQRMADAVRRLYVEGDADPIAVLLGATSMDEALAGLDTLERATDRNRRLVTDLSTQLERLHAARLRLDGQRTALAGAVASAAAAESELARRVAARRGYLAALRHERSLTAARLQTLAARAQAAQQASAQLRSRGAHTPSAPPAKPLLQVEPTGARTMVVDAVAYHLPGHTASGLPVGRGVVAVDPTVIPLGTKLYVPGYGSAVAADVGSAIRGPIIDLWFPTTAEARAWGRRTVTITVFL